MRYAEVAVNASWGPTSTFSYSIPSNLDISPGQAVWVPFGPRTQQGIVIQVTDNPAYADTKPIAGIIGTAPVTSQAHVELARWISRRYLAPIFDCASLMMPPGFVLNSYATYSLAKADSTNSLQGIKGEIVSFIGSRGSASQKDTEKEFGAKRAASALSSLTRQGILARKWEWSKPSAGPLVRPTVQLAIDPKLAMEKAEAFAHQRQTVKARLLSTLAGLSGPIERYLLQDWARASKEHFNALEKDGLITESSVQVYRDPISSRRPSLDEPTNLTLTGDQERAWLQIKDAIITSLNGKTPDPILLFGVTASGKTEMYLRAVQDIVEMDNRQAIVLVPEIALTPQAIDRFSRRFPGKVAVMHSGLTPGEQFDEWWRIQRGDFDVVIGPRSAIFAPVPRLGIIIVDEEHEPAYKQGSPPHYHARDVAIELARLTGAVTILGTATPDVETFHRAEQGDLKLVRLPRRVPFSRPSETALEKSYTNLANVTLVDMRHELKTGNRSIFSRKLQSSLEHTLAAGEQAILFLNRRGSSTFVQCRDCGYVVSCKTCQVAMTYHREGEAMVCHQCDRHTKTPTKCPECQSARIRFLGAGTQRVQEEVESLFPKAKSLRLDSDTTKERNASAKILDSFVAHEADILIGTQMVVKGLHLPMVTLVGVVSADTALYVPDFRSSERTFQLLCQVAGRTGRSPLGGNVVIQTYTPEHYAIQAAAKQDYELFYSQEKKYREELDQPPFNRLARLVFSHTNAEYALQTAKDMAVRINNEILRTAAPRSQVLGPVQAFPARLSGRWRWQLILRSPEPEKVIRNVLSPDPEKARAPLKPDQGWEIDIDPVGMD